MRPPALNSGLIGHRAMAALYQGGEVAARAVIAEERAVFEKMFQEEQEHYGDIPGNIEGMLDIYLAEYGEPDTASVECTEEEFSIEIGDLTILCKPDLVEDADGGTFRVVDHKFTAQFPSDRTDKLSDLQLLLYGFVLEQAAAYRISSVMWNCLKHKPPKSADALYRLEIPYSRQAALGVMKDFVFTAEQIRLHERRGYFPHTVSRWCNTCTFKGLCTMEVRGIDTKETLRRDFVQEHREEVHAIEAE